MWLLTLSAVLPVLAQVNGDLLSRKTPDCQSGREGQVLVHLFSWKWADVAKECENVLGPKGFCGVQVSPPNEHRIVTTPDRPWWERYQPISYKLESASGSRAEFTDMVQRCKAAGVRIYIDAVINHMAGIDAGTGLGSGGSYYNTQELKFSGVPYGPEDFNTRCTTGSLNIENYADADQVRNCRLVGLLDLEGGIENVRRKIADYFNDMLQIGIDGYRIDAAKHMWPEDLNATLALTRLTESGKQAFVYQEVIENGNEPVKTADYKHIGRLVEFNYGFKMTDIFKWHHTKLRDLESFGSGWGLMPAGDALVSIDNHDNQRGHGGGGNVISFKQPDEYKMAVIFMLSWPYGVPRVMSSYDFQQDWTGPPSGAPGDSGACNNGWICEHRWRAIANMVSWRNSAGSSNVMNWWSNGNNQMAYSRGSSSFIAFNKEGHDMNEVLQTGLPSGTYCDVISGELQNGRCTGKTVTVQSDSTAAIEISREAETPVIAIHMGSRLSGNPAPPVDVPVTRSVPQTTETRPTSGPDASTTTPVTPASSAAPPSGVTNRTIVFIRKTTSPGQEIFLRGEKTTSYYGCASDCAIDITYPPARSGSAFDNYNKYSRGDTELDWDTAKERTQTNGANGSPMAWTSNNPSHSNYDPENIYGDHYWLWDVMMDCSKVNNGYFEIKGKLGGDWESDISQSTCDGQPSESPQSRRNHVARCGYKNVFTWNTNSCRMEPLEN